MKNVVSQANYMPNTFITNMLDELTQSNQALLIDKAKIEDTKQEQIT